MLPVMFGSLPNISGEFGWERSGFANIATGAFSGVTLSSNSAPQMTDSSSDFKAVHLSASNSNAMYSGSSIQVPALQTLVCIKI